MVSTVFDAQSILTYQFQPSLVLDCDGVVLAANQGSRLLITATHTEAQQLVPDPLIGQHISSLGLAVQAGVMPGGYRTWNEILNAARSRDISQHERCPPEATIYSHISPEDSSFWNEDAFREGTIESNVLVTRQIKGCSMIKARAAIRWIHRNDSGHFLVTCSRPSSSQALTLEPSAVFQGSSNAFSQAVQNTSYFVQSPQDCLQQSAFEYKELNVSLAGTINFSSPMIPCFTATMDMGGQVTELSKSWLEFTGLTDEESLGTGWLSAIHPSDAVAVKTAWTDVLKNEREHWTHQARYRKASDGQYYWFLLRAEPYRDPDGKVLRWHASTMDIHDWVMARLEGDRQRQAMLTLLSQTDVLFWGIDTTYHMYICEGRLDWNPSVVMDSLLGESTDSDTGHVDGSHDQDRRKIAYALRAVLRGDASNTTVEHWEGKRFFRTKFVAERPVNEGKIEAALALTFDVTDEKARNSLEIENQRLVDNEKAALAADELKSRFLANMSHEIRTPISGIIGLTDHLLDCALSEEQAEFAISILESANFLLTVINDVLDFSKIESGHMDMESVPFSPSMLIHDVSVPLRLQAQDKGLTLTSSCALESNVVVLGDPWRMRQVLTNLTGNSLKFTNTGHISLEVRTIPHDDPTKMMVQFIVEDTGDGIDQESLKTLFKAFKQADSSTARLHGGTGLGLVICRQLVELMGGIIALESSLGEGTTATCSIPFPVYDGPDSDTIATPSLPRRARTYGRSSSLKTRPKRANSAPDQGLTRPGLPIITPPREGKQHILLAEDNAVNRRVIALVVKKLGYTVSVACDGQEALRYLRKDSSEKRPVAVIMDCQMPIVDGYEATRRIRSDVDVFDEETRALPIIALTASAIKGDRQKCWDAGMDDHLTKPASKEALRRTLAKWTAADRPHDVGYRSSSSGSE